MHRLYSCTMSSTWWLTQTVFTMVSMLDRDAKCASFECWCDLVQLTVRMWESNYIDRYKCVALFSTFESDSLVCMFLSNCREILIMLLFETDLDSVVQCKLLQKYIYFFRRKCCFSRNYFLNDCKLKYFRNCWFLLSICWFFIVSM